MARVIFLTDFSEAYARELLLGMARYAHDTAQAWSLCRLPLSIRDKFGIEAVVEWALRMKADAVIGQFYNTDNVELFRKNGIIAIAQDFKKRFTTIPNITGPHYSAGRMAAEYFLQKGFRNFAFYGTRGIDFSDERCQGFRETIEAANPEFTFSSLRSSAQNDLWYYDSTQLITWLQSLPKPVAIMACDDNQAYHITEACLQIEGGEIPASRTTSPFWAWTTTRRSASSPPPTFRRSIHGVRSRAATIDAAPDRPLIRTPKRSGRTSW